MRIIRQSAFTAAPWKNGGGITHEAIRVPAGGDPFRWRVSVAHIERSGPFSEFAAHNRTMVLLRGNGAALKFAGGEERCLSRVGDMTEFDGGVATQCELKSGPCVDLNLMTAKSLGAVRAEVRRFVAGLELPAAPGSATLVFPIDAPAALRAGGEAAVLEAWDLAVVSHAAESAYSLAPRDPAGPVLVFLATLPDP